MTDNTEETVVETVTITEKTVKRLKIAGVVAVSAVAVSALVLSIKNKNDLSLIASGLDVTIDAVETALDK